MTNKELTAEIQKLQRIQQTNSPKSAAWKKASRGLAALFLEAAMRQREGRADGIASL